MSQGGVSEKVDALAAQARPMEAAELAAQSGLHDRAAGLFEQACDFARASDQAGLAGDARRAIVLAALAGDDQRVRHAEDTLAGEPNRARAAAEELKARGHVAVAARLLERVGDVEDAAVAYANAGLAIEAARAYERVGKIREAARVLESAHRSNPYDEVVSVRLARLLVDHKRFDAATRLLQSIPNASDLRAEALPLLAACYEALGLEDPLAAIRQEANSAGIKLDSTAVASPHAAEVAKIVYGRYEIVRPVASTPSARVYEALDRVTQQRVALKQLRTEGLLGAGRDAFERLVREATALQTVRHPNVVPLVELVADGGAVITPWMPGGSLADVMKREGLSPDRAVEIASAVLSALGEAHRLGILHRDVKPSNILFDDAGVARLADFGAAHVSDSSATATAGVIGTLAYMSPEQRYGHPATPASDVYSVGATLLEMLTGQPPPMTGPSVAPSSCHPDLRPEHDAIIAQLLAEAASQRIASALDARKQLLGMRWPKVVRGEALIRSDGVATDEAPDRLQPLEGEVFLDRWLERRVVLVPDSEAMRRIARAYAAAASPGLSSVVRFDADRACIWFEVPDGEPLSELGRPLGADEKAVLETALQRLHRHGVAHGSVDARHVVLRGGTPVLVFDPRTVEWASPDQDLQGLDRLG